MNYLSDRQLSYNSSIIEYDIKHANINVSKYYNLYKDFEYLDTLDALPKKDREVKFGLLLRKNPNLSKSLEESFNKIVKEFLEANDLDILMDVLSIKKDAVYVINHKVTQTKFGPVEFIPKNVYHAFININKLEFYIASDYIDVKGIGDSYRKHKDGILLMIQSLVDNLEQNGDPNEYLSELVKLYKNKKLSIEAYREFNSRSQYKCCIDGIMVMMDDISYEILDSSCDISYNYINIILPLIRLLL